ncbi:MAG: hypothetical protein GY727_09820 [Gammaproteobacteria bacterium]|nr:hypothetical protein [Gammaproteobacteria bacterium]MCP4090753.1 hypothetical protein [Gammaproteobacteria bacterium]MCP4277180.1 hypothetical protein [Gammaproteobacteria bacterium]MCP4831686.1 hypothetical protein [Gammaproteobacteria bacterium]MCP4928010.1 hypothetical protein [Gammaproteobacteria bacterium]
MTEESTQQHVSVNAEFFIILGVMLAVLGVITAIAPLADGLAVEFVAGIMVLSRSSMQFYYGIKVRHWGGRFYSYMGLGSILMSFVSVACAVVLLLNPVAPLSFLALLVAAYLVVMGGFDFLQAIELRPVKGWQLIFMNGLLGIALGILVLQSLPIPGRWAVGIFVGLSLFMSGLSLCGLGFFGLQYRIKIAGS